LTYWVQVQHKQIASWLNIIEEAWVNTGFMKRGEGIAHATRAKNATS